MGKASVLIVLSDSIIQGRLSLFQFKFQNLHKIFYALLIYKFHRIKNIFQIIFLLEINKGGNKYGK